MHSYGPAVECTHPVQWVLDLFPGGKAARIIIEQAKTCKDL